MFNIKNKWVLITSLYKTNMSNSTHIITSSYINHTKGDNIIRFLELNKIKYKQNLISILCKEIKKKPSYSSWYFNIIHQGLSWKST
jgi:hypothetical protein